MYSIWLIKWNGQVCQMPLRIGKKIFAPLSATSNKYFVKQIKLKTVNIFSTKTMLIWGDLILQTEYKRLNRYTSKNFWKLT